MEIKVIKKTIKGGKIQKIKLRYCTHYQIPTPYGWESADWHTVTVSQKRPSIFIGHPDTSARLFNGETIELNLMGAFVNRTHRKWIKSRRLRKLENA